ncbi:unnamed protein product, partial [Brassica oleracea]
CQPQPPKKPTSNDSIGRFGLHRLRHRNRRQTQHQSWMIQPRRSQTTEIKAGYTASRRPPCTRNYVTGQEGGRDEGTTASSLSLSTFLREKGETLPFP